MILSHECVDSTDILGPIPFFFNVSCPLQEGIEVTLSGRSDMPSCSYYHTSVLPQGSRLTATRT